MIRKQNKTEIDSCQKQLRIDTKLAIFANFLTNFAKILLKFDVYQMSAELSINWQLLPIMTI